MLPIKDDVPSSSRPVVMYLLILLNVLVFLYETSLSRPALHQLFAGLGVTPAAFATGRGGLPANSDVYLTLLTSMFIHGSWLHLIGNMWYLWIFGDNVEDLMGHVGFLAFYMMGGIVASITHIVMNWGADIPSIGASGAIAAVLGAYLILFPGARILTIVPFFFLFVARLPAMLVLGVWFLLQLVSGVGSLGVSSTGTGVAFWAHIGGFLFGLLVVGLFAPRRRRRRPPRPPLPPEPVTWLLSEGDSSWRY